MSVIDAKLKFCHMLERIACIQKQCKFILPIVLFGNIHRTHYLSYNAQKYSFNCYNVSIQYYILVILKERMKRYTHTSL